MQGTDVSSGNLHLSFADLSLPSIGVPFSLEHSYNTCPSTSNPGKWNFNLEQTLTFLQENSAVANWPSVEWRRPDGSLVDFYLDTDGTYKSATPGVHDLLTEDFNAGTFTIYSATSPTSKAAPWSSARARRSGHCWREHNYL